jgi:hypothetical protein
MCTWALPYRGPSLRLVNVGLVFRHKSGFWTFKMANSHSRPESPRSVAQVPAFITMLQVDNVLVDGVFYNLEDTMARLDWLADNYSSYDRFATNLCIGTLTRIRNNRIGLIDPFTQNYRALHDPIGTGVIAWEWWWNRHGVPTNVDGSPANEYIRLWSRFRREGSNPVEVDLSLSDSEDEGLVTQASF